jgi:phosphoglycolate phosphatase
VTRLFVFDLDGTLVDSLRDLADSANELLVSCGGMPLDANAVARMVGEGAATLVSRVFEAANVEKPADALSRFLTIYDTNLLNHTRPYDGMEETLASLSSHASLAVLTNKPLEASRRILDGLRLSRFFDAGAVIGGDGPLPRKPDPAGLQLLCARAGVTVSDAVLVGDSLIDWQTARNAGTAICLARYGFGFREFPRETLNGREQVIDRPIDLVRAT